MTLPDERMIKNQTIFFQNPIYHMKIKILPPSNDIKVILNSFIDSHSAIP